MILDIIDILCSAYSNFKKLSEVHKRFFADFKYFIWAEINDAVLYNSLLINKYILQGSYLIA